MLALGVGGRGAAKIWLRKTFAIVRRNELHYIMQYLKELEMQDKMQQCISNNLINLSWKIKVFLLKIL